MRTVLIPTDFSNSAMHAIDYALNLYKCERTNFYFLHAYADEVYGPFKTHGETSIEERKKTVGNNTDKSLKNLIQKLAVREYNPKHTYETLSAFDTLVDAVNEFANKINIDLVIMGTKGQTADKNITFGSHTVQVFKYVQCPVLAVPLDYKYQQPKKILFPTDYMLPYKRRELKLLDTLASEFKSEIHCLYISDFEDLSFRQMDNQRFLKESLGNAFLFFERHPTTNKVEAIMDYIKKNNINLLVMVNSRHSFLEDMLYRSTVDDIGLRLKLPFLVMQNLPR
ncbi:MULTISPECIES: universal stress protein [unclassified Arenibacter]|uniref:universal stress protein n=1 Tax=unclassified Arenibacter TaxID=2615047 RepID=UPI000E341392|nr:MULTISPECIES: universal stress protein [unclassified Arenibacter]MCM4163426.1 universal stress protein [Arenibacter sp. A80]RFT57425.1 universal stress protein [Arenibacter sp. P308M17]